MGRAPCCDKANVKKGPWSPEEDATLKTYIEEHGTGGNWIALPQKIGLKRCGKSCRLRWLNYLRPNIRHGGFSEEEDRIICSLYISIGSRWSIIAAQLPGRTDNDIKNYWNTRLKKKLLGKRMESSQSRRHAIDIGSNEEANYGMNHESPQGLSESALERMQLHMQLQGLRNPHSFYDNPALWPKSHLLGETTQVLSQQGHDAISTSPVQQASSEDTKPDQPTYDATFLTHCNVTTSASMQEDMDSSTLGFPSPSSTDTNLNYAEDTNRSVEALYASGLPTEYHDLLYNKNAAHGLQEEPQMDGAYWWPSSGLSSTGSWDPSSLQSDSLLQDYALRYDLYASGC